MTPANPVPMREIKKPFAIPGVRSVASEDLLMKPKKATSYDVVESILRALEEYQDDWCTAGFLATITGYTRYTITKYLEIMISVQTALECPTKIVSFQLSRYMGYRLRRPSKP